MVFRGGSSLSTLRDLGYRISLAINEKNRNELLNRLDFSEVDLKKLEQGRLSLTPRQLDDVSEILNLSKEELLDYTDNTCYQNMVHCMSCFSNQENCNKILDIIDSYIDLKESCSCLEMM